MYRPLGAYRIHERIVRELLQSCSNYTVEISRFVKKGPVAQFKPSIDRKFPLNFIRLRINGYDIFLKQLPLGVTRIITFLIII